ncbi:MAG: T9SS type A sorting domain-containing protein [Bacteroidota bacterium]
MKRSLTSFFLFLFVFTGSYAQQSTCSNRDFEDQNFNNWNGIYGTYQAPGNTGFQSNGNNAAYNDPQGRHTIYTVNQLDPYAIDPQTGQPDVYMTTLAPNGGLASVRLGNTINGGQGEGLRYAFAVTPNDTVFTYQYACVFEDPGHPLTSQPSFWVRVFDPNNNMVNSLSDTVFAGDTTYGFIASPAIGPNGSPILYKRWSGVSINLAAYVNQTVTIEFYNSDCAFSGHFGYTYLDLPCFGSYIANVWPGDCDYDLTANNVDLITLGIAFGATGPVRPGASNNWTAQPMSDWPQWFQLGANYKHSDCNGDGTVNFQDTVAISLNYSNTHPFRYAGPPETNSAYPNLYLVADDDTVGTNQLVNFDIMLGTGQLPVDSIYGIAFKLSYDPNHFQANLANCSFNTSWMGLVNSNLMQMQRNFPAPGYMDVTLVRNEQTNIGGFGQIGTLKMKMPPSGTGIIQAPVTISDVYAVTVGKRTVSLNLVPDYVIFNPNIAGLSAQQFDDHFGLYPNPSSGQFTLTANGNEIYAIELYNPLGQLLMSLKPDADRQQIDAGSLPPGSYMLRVVSAKGTFHTKVQIIP